MEIATEEVREIVSRNTSYNWEARCLSRQTMHITYVVTMSGLRGARCEAVELTLQALPLSAEPVYASRPARPGRFPAGWPGTLSWWRRGDSTFRGFRCGLDYAFIRGTRESTRMRSVLSG